MNSRTIITTSLACLLFFSITSVVNAQVSFKDLLPEKVVSIFDSGEHITYSSASVAFSYEPTQQVRTPQEDRSSVLANVFNVLTKPFKNLFRSTTEPVMSQEEEIVEEETEELTNTQNTGEPQVIYKEVPTRVIERTIIREIQPSTTALYTGITEEELTTRLATLQAQLQKQILRQSESDVESTNETITTSTDEISGTTAIFTGNVTANKFIGDGSELTGINAGASAVSALTDVSLSSLTTGDLLKYDGSSWANVATSSLKIAVSDLVGDTDDLTEGSTNLYWTDTRFDTRLTATTTLPAITTLANLASVGTITTGVWNGTTVGVAYGGTGATTLTSGGLLYGNGTGAISALPVLTNGQLLIGDADGVPTAATLTAGSNITITNGAGSIEIAASGGSPVGNDKQIQFNDGGSFAGTSDLYWNKSTERLGINTTSPDATIEIEDFWDSQLRLTHSSGKYVDFKLDTNSNLLVTFPSSTDTFGIYQANLGVGTSFADDGKIEVKGGTVCVDTNSDNTASSCIASESDERLKRNIITLGNSLELVRSLRPVTFEWRYDDPSILAHYPEIGRFRDQPESLGFIAQEVQKVLPLAIMQETVGDDEIQYLQLNYDAILPAAVGAIQELDLRLGELEAHIASSTAKESSSSVWSPISSAIDQARIWMEGEWFRFTNIWADKIRTKELCIEDVCVTRNELKSLLEKASTHNNQVASPTAQNIPLDITGSEEEVDVPEEDTPTTTDSVIEEIPEEEATTEEGTEEVIESQEEEIEEPAEKAEELEKPQEEVEELEEEKTTETEEVIEE